MAAVRNSIFAAIMGSMALLPLAACTHDTEGSTSSNNSDQQHPGPTSPRPTLTDPKLQPPTQSSTESRPAIIFDPCTWISDDTVRKSGFDPRTRKRGHDQIAETSFLTCSFDSDSGDTINFDSLLVNSGNAPWDEDLAKVRNYSRPVTVNGREAMWVRDPQVKSMCQIDLRTKAGFVQVAVATNDPQSERPCGNLMNIASNIETEIGKEN
ncbi:DUF3558 domain-containing protein [Nocardia nova]|uniref:DUF3558 domain-containing protein n=1 Tax=Nocardia nova TaxID=37330 RepID=UPI000CEA69A0|nr:DUF3558 domain-containing protein [Nocardia nova]PPJ23343.1 hypothetical protein C5E41_25125 [Nocardia nova]